MRRPQRAMVPPPLLYMPRKCSSLSGKRTTLTKAVCLCIKWRMVLCTCPRRKRLELHPVFLATPVSDAVPRTRHSRHHNNKHTQGRTSTKTDTSQKRIGRITKQRNEQRTRGNRSEVPTDHPSIPQCQSNRVRKSAPRCARIAHPQHNQQRRHKRGVSAMQANR